MAINPNKKGLIKWRVVFRMPLIAAGVIFRKKGSSCSIEISCNHFLTC